MKKNLITTGLYVDKFNDHPDFFLGRWAIDYECENLKNDINDYHWDDRRILHNDFNEINSLYENLLPKISQSLNELHNIKKSRRYWRILIGPWLGIWLQIMLDRWKSIISLKYKEDEFETTIAKYDDFELAAVDTRDFIDNLSSSDEFNHIIYSKIIKFNNFIKFHESKSFSVHNIKRQNNKKIFQLLKNKLKNIICNVVNIFSLNNKIVFIDTYLSLSQKISLDINLSQFPSILNNSIDFKHSNNTINNLRGNIKINYSAKSQFEEFILINIVEMMPKLFIEDYKNASEKINKTLWPKSPDTIIAAVLIVNDFTKLWVAEKVEAGSKLVIEQHGGHYGSGKFSFYESHELKISDLYLSWGWDNGNKKIKKIAHPKLRTNITYNKNGGIYQILMALPRYSYTLYSAPIASQVYEYANDQLMFSKTLKDELQKKLSVKFALTNRGYDQRKRYDDDLSFFKEGKENIYKAINNNRLIVCTYNATTILECIAANIPTVIFWNFDYWELNKQAEPYFNELKKVNILHDGYESAANFINDNWEDIDSWWHSSETQDVVNNFKNKYAYTHSNWKDSWIEAIKSIADK